MHHSHQVFTAYSLERMNSKLLLILSRQSLCFSFGGLFFLLSLFFFFSFLPYRRGGGWRYGALLSECVVLCSTHTCSVCLFLYLLVSRVCRRPPPLPAPKYAMKAVGSLMPTHFHNLVYWKGGGWVGASGEGQRGVEFLLSALFLSREAVACSLWQGGGHWEGRKWLPFTMELKPCVYLIFHSVPPSHFFKTLFG